MLKQIRSAMSSNELNFFDTILEMDETYIGGKPKKQDKDDDDFTPNGRGRATKKTPVVGVIDRETKQAFAKVMLANKQGKKLTGKQLLSVLEELTKGNVTVMTDEFRGYNILSHDSMRR